MQEKGGGRSMPKRFTVEKACRIVSVLSRNDLSLTHFDTEHIGAFPDLKAELIALDRVFTNDFGDIEYRNLRHIVVLACAIRLSAVIMKTNPVQRRSMSNWIGMRNHLHHDADLTPLVASQFPQAKEDEFLFGKDYYDLVVGNTAVEVGDCRVSKILEALKEGMNLWVLPKPFDTIYVFTRGRNWRSFERLENCILDTLKNALEKARW
jgi:hypothetical protein